MSLHYFPTLVYIQIGTIMQVMKRSPLMTCGLYQGLDPPIVAESPVCDTKVVIWCSRVINWVSVPCDRQWISWLAFRQCCSRICIYLIPIYTEYSRHMETTRLAITGSLITGSLDRSVSANLRRARCSPGAQVHLQTNCFCVHRNSCNLSVRTKIIFANHLHRRHDRNNLGTIMCIILCLSSAHLWGRNIVTNAFTNGLLDLCRYAYRQFFFFEFNVLLLKFEHKVFIKFSSAFVNCLVFSDSILCSVVVISSVHKTIVSWSFSYLFVFVQ